MTLPAPVVAIQPAVSIGVVTQTGQLRPKAGGIGGATDTNAVFRVGRGARSRGRSAHPRPLYVSAHRFVRERAITAGHPALLPAAPLSKPPLPA